MMTDQTDGVRGSDALWGGTLLTSMHVHMNRLKRTTEEAAETKRALDEHDRGRYVCVDHVDLTARHACV